MSWVARSTGWPSSTELKPGRLYSAVVVRVNGRLTPRGQFQADQDCLSLIGLKRLVTLTEGCDQLPRTRAVRRMHAGTTVCGSATGTQAGASKTTSARV